MKTAKDLRKHAFKRMRQRFVDIDFNIGLYNDAVNCIVNQKPINKCVPLQHLYKQSNTRTIWLLSIHDKECVAIYDTKRKAIVTFMPKDWVINEDNSLVGENCDAIRNGTT